MKEQLKKITKQSLSKLGIYLTKNQAYDAQLALVIKKIGASNPKINTLDIGAHLGEIADLFLQYAPQGTHYIFEPIPAMHSALKNKYLNVSNLKVYDLALSNQSGEVYFYHNQTHPAYSGIKKRAYPSAADEVNKIRVQTESLDHLLANEKNIQFGIMKIDVEGGEFGVLQGATQTIAAHRPIIIFEHGLGASEFYNTRPENVFDLLTELNMNISLMKNWLAEKPHHFSKEAFCKQFYDKLNYYFIAYPKS